MNRFFAHTPVPLPVALQCYCRTYCVNAAVTTHGMLHLGFLFALDPGLMSIHKDDKALEEARLRALPHCNAHALMMPLLIGLVLYCECLIASKNLPDAQARVLMQTAFSTLSAIGDSFFGASLLSLWALSTALCLIYHMPWIAVAWTCFLICFVQIFRMVTFARALLQGIAFLAAMRSWNLMVWSQRIKIVNAALVACVLYSVAYSHNITWGAISLWWSVAWLICGVFWVIFARLPRLFLVLFVVCVMLTV